MKNAIQQGSKSRNSNEVIRVDNTNSNFFELIEEEKAAHACASPFPLN